MAQSSGITIGTDAFPAIASMFGIGPLVDDQEGDAGMPPADAAPVEPGPEASAAPTTQPSTAGPTKLDALKQFFGASTPRFKQGDQGIPPAQGPVPRNYAGMNLPSPGTINPTFAQAHPKLMAFLKIAQGAGEGGLVGSQYDNAGAGYQAAHAVPLQRMMAGLQAQDMASQIRQRNASAKLSEAHAQAIANPPEKAVKPQPFFDKSGDLIGFQDSDGNFIGPNSPKLTQDQKDMIAATKGKSAAAGTPEAQALADLVKGGMAPFDAYRKLQETKSDVKPDTATQQKQRIRTLEQNLSAGTITDPDRQELATAQQEAKAQGLGSEIIAQIGKPPVPAQFPKGESDPAFKAANLAWGKNAEAVKNREAAAAGAARGEAYGSFRPVQVIDPSTRELKWMFAGNAISSGAAPAGEGVKAMSKQQQFAEMHVAAQKAKDSITGLDRDFTPDQVAKLTLAFSHDDQGIVKNAVDTFLGTQRLTPAQQDFVVWINQLNERAMSLRNIAGMGQGSQDLRAAIKATLPGLKSGSKEFALKQLDAFNNQVNILEKGIPKVKNPNQNTAPDPHPLSKKYPGFVPD